MPDYGLEALVHDDENDELNDDTPSGLGDEWAQGNEASLWDGQMAGCRPEDGSGHGSRRLL